MGINIQYVKNNELCIKTLATRALDQKHTAAYLKQIILKVLDDYEIKMNQIYTITSDNGRNMLKCTSDIKEALINECTDDENNDESDDENDDQINTLLNETVSLFQSNVMVNTIRCAAHTTQLAVLDAIKALAIEKQITECRKVAMALRKPSNHMKLESLKLRKAILNVPTRWNSTYDMLERLKDLKPFCDDENSNDPALYISDNLFKFICDFIESFKPLKEITINLQKNQLCFTNFYEEWLVLKLKVKKLNTQKYYPQLSKNGKKY